MYAHVTSRLSPFDDVRIVEQVSQAEINEAIAFGGKEAMTLTLDDNGEYGDGIICTLTSDGEKPKEMMWMRFSVAGARTMIEALQNILNMREIERTAND